MLTKKQEEFTLLLFQGDTQRTAYKSAYPTSKTWKETAVDCEASKLASNPKVIQRLSELRSKAEDKAVITLDGIVKDIYRMSQEYEREAEGLRALDMLMKHLGGYEKDNTVTLTGTVVTVLPEKDPDN